MPPFLAEIKKKLRTFNEMIQIAFDFTENVDVNILKMVSDGVHEHIL